MKKKHYILFLLSMIFKFLFQQEPVMRNFTTREGIPSQEVYHVYQDKKGYIWICTDAGLAKYNANEFKIFNSTNGMPDNTIFEVKEDRHGRIWFRTITGKTGYVKNDSVFTISANEIVSSFYKEGMSGSFTIDGQDRLIFGRKSVSESSFLCISPPYDEASAKKIWTDTTRHCGFNIVLMQGGDVVLSERRAFCDDEIFSISIYDEKRNLLFKDTTAHTTPLCRLARKGDIIYLGIDSILKVLDTRNKRSFIKKVPGYIIGVIPQDTGIWLGIRYKGIHFYADITSDKVPHRFLTTSSVSYMTKDFQNGFWFSTLNNGVYYMSNPEFYSYRNFSGNKSIELCKVAPLSQNDFIVCNTEGNVFLSSALQNPGSEPEKIYSDIARQLGTVNDVVKISDNKILICGTQGTILYEPVTAALRPAMQYSPPELKKTSLKQVIIYRDRLLCFNYKDIFIADTVSFNIRDTIKSADRITSLFYDEKEDVCYVGGVHGLYTYNGEHEIIASNKILNLRIEDIKMSKAGLVLASKEAGLIIKRGNTFDTIDSKKGLLSDICRKIQTCHDTIWVLTSKGMSRVIYSDPNNYSIFNLPLNTFESIASINSFCVIGKQLVFSSATDLFIYPLKVREERERFYIKAFYANNEIKDLNSSIELKYSESNIKIFFEALFYKNSDILQYRYKFSEGDNAWNYATESYASFPSLSPGTYSLLLQARNNYGEWVPFDKQILFTIQKPFWLSWWFILAESALGIIIVTRLVIIRNRKSLMKERIRYQLQLHMQELRIGLIKAQMNPHFIFNSLNSIQNFILANDNDNAYKYLSKFSKLVRKILETSSHEYISLPDETEILIKYLEIESLRFEDSFQYEVTIDPLINQQRIKIPQMMIQPVIENAIWHGLLHKKGERKLNVSFTDKTNQTILCIVDDNGAGRNNNSDGNAVQSIVAKKSISTNLLLQRLELIEKTSGIKGSINIIDKKTDDGKAAGTRVEIIIPVFN